MKQRSSIFQIGQRLHNSRLTIIGSVEPDSWRLVLCHCDCGKNITIPYIRAYTNQFSCGCKRRVRVDSVDYANTTFTNPNGNMKYARTLTILYRDHETGRWLYTCECCGEVFEMPRGMERGIRSSLKELAGQVCPNFRGLFIGLDRIERLTSYITQNGGLVDFTHHPTREKMALYFEKRFNADCIRRDRKGKILGFYGDPRVLPEDIERRRISDEKLALYEQTRKADFLPEDFEDPIVPPSELVEPTYDFAGAD